jgi:hypothetical protein
MPDASAPIDRLLVAAIADRLIFGHPETFQADDARALRDALPSKRVPWLEVGAAGKISGGSTQGFAAGVGNVRIKDKDDRQFAVSNAGDTYVRAGQWKLLRQDRGRVPYVEIEQVMASPLDEGRGARIRFTRDGTPAGMDIRHVRSIRVLFSFVTLQLPYWQPWKTPV